MHSDAMSEQRRDDDLEALLDVKQGSGALWKMAENRDKAIALCREARDEIERLEARIWGQDAICNERDLALEKTERAEARAGWAESGG